MIHGTEIYERPSTSTHYSSIVEEQVAKSFDRKNTNKTKYNNTKNKYSIKCD